MGCFTGPGWGDHDNGCFNGVSIYDQPHLADYVRPDLRDLDPAIVDILTDEERAMLADETPKDFS